MGEQGKVPSRETGQVSDAGRREGREEGGMLAPIRFLMKHVKCENNQMHQ